MKEDYRRLFGVLFSDFYLFENLSFLIDVKKLKNSQWVVPLGMTSIVEELIAASTAARPFNAKALSQGQKRRLGIILTLLEERPIYIFDEPTADLDPDFTEYFYRILLPMLALQGKAVVVVTHDIYYFGECDNLVSFGKKEFGKTHLKPAVATELT